IGGEPINFLRHGTIITAKSCLHVSHADAHLHSHERASNGGVHVADHNDPVRLLFGANFLEADHHAGGLDGVGAAADAEVDVRSRNAEFFEENVRHGGVVVLAG